MKQCPRCGENKPHTEYYVQKGRRGDGLGAWCRVCVRRDRKEKYLEDPNKFRERGRSSYAENAGIRREERKARYWSDPEKYRGHRDKYRRANPEKIKANNRGRKARELGASGRHTAQEVRQMAEHQDWLCAYCEAPMFGDFHVDHMLPLCRGGSNSWENLAITCPTCNLQKRDKTVEEFYASRRGALVESR